MVSRCSGISNVKKVIFSRAVSDKDSRLFFFSAVPDIRLVGYDRYQYPPLLLSLCVLEGDEENLCSEGGR
jgi:hypothetical protein